MFIFNKRGPRKYIHVFSSFHDAKTLLRNRYRAKFDTIADFTYLHIIYITVESTLINSTVLLEHTIHLLNDNFNLSIIECLQSFLETQIRCVEWNRKRLISVNCNFITQMLARRKNATVLRVFSIMNCRFIQKTILFRVNTTILSGELHAYELKLHRHFFFV